MSEVVNPLGDEGLERLKKAVPGTEKGIFSAFEGQATNSVASVVGGLVGLQNPDVYSIVERTNLPANQRVTIRRMIQLAEHGIGGPLDIPKGFVAHQVVMDLRLRVSQTDPQGHGMSREEVERILSAWSRIMEQREAEERKKRQAGAAG